jgi:hypothetical protein
MPALRAVRVVEQRDPRGAVGSYSISHDLRGRAVLRARSR